MDQKRRCTRPQHAKKQRRRGPSVREPLLWTPLFLVQFASRLFENLDVDQPGCRPTSVLLLTYLAQSVTFRWGSACSGTESPHWVFIALAEAALANMVFEQAYSAEMDSAKRDWIMTQAHPKCLFSDIFDITRSTARCAISGMVDVKQVCHSVVTDLFISGFSCKSVSALANDDQTRMAPFATTKDRLELHGGGVSWSFRRPARNPSFSRTSRA